MRDEMPLDPPEDAPATIQPDEQDAAREALAEKLGHEPDDEELAEMAIPNPPDR
ncbi:MAG TPA: hypothetical protein VGM37_10120 [Armatimonadota bacterium]|jgi:hypothetical protein